MVFGLPGLTVNLGGFGGYTPENERLEPKNHPYEKEHHLNQTSICVYHVILPEGINLFIFKQGLVHF